MNRFFAGFDLKNVRRTVLVLMCLNAAFWLYFWIDIGFRVTPYDGPRPEFHGDMLPEYVWYGRGVPYPEVSSQALSLKLMRAGQQPTHAIVKFLSLQVMNRAYPPVYVYRGEIFGGVSYAGYQVLATRVLSFVQWYLIARLLDWLISKRRDQMAFIRSHQH
jgi:hypothetical protein